MDHGAGSDGEFLVLCDEVAGERMRLTRVRRLLGAGAMVVATGVAVTVFAVLRITVGGAGVTGPGRSLAVLMAAVVGPVLLVMPLRSLVDLRRFRGAPGAGPVAMWLSDAGLRSGTDLAPGSIFLPWEVVAGAYRTSWKGVDLLVVEVIPGTTAATPEVEGLDQVDVRRMVHDRRYGPQGLLFATSLLRQPLPEIDEAFAQFTGGRVRIR